MSSFSTFRSTLKCLRKSSDDAGALTSPPQVGPRLFQGQEGREPSQGAPQPAARGGSWRSAHRRSCAVRFLSVSKGEVAVDLTTCQRRNSPPAACGRRTVSGLRAVPPRSSGLLARGSLGQFLLILPGLPEMSLDARAPRQNPRCPVRAPSAPRAALGAP